MKPWQAFWSQLALRERRLVLVAGVVVVAAVLWLALIGPALRTLRTAPAQHRTLDAQLQSMQTLQAQARALQQQAPLTRAESQRALTQATQQVLGNAAQLSISGDRATVTLQGASPETLALWLAQARANARTVPQEAHLTRQTLANGVRWSGTLVLDLPGR
ncbi:MAG: type II secretion system protein GspM [Rhodoferax sp.]